MVDRTTVDVHAMTKIQDMYICGAYVRACVSTGL
jgi:hypothetical protein